MAGWPSDVDRRGLRAMVDRSPGELGRLVESSGAAPLLERSIARAQRWLLWRIPHLACFWRLLVRLRLDWWPERLALVVEGMEFRGWIDDSTPRDRFGAIVFESTAAHRIRPGAVVAIEGRRFRPQERPGRAR